jgi:hypothetical protein
MDKRKKDKRKSNDIQSIAQKTKDRAIRAIYIVDVYVALVAHELNIRLAKNFGFVADIIFCIKDRIPVCMHLSSRN